MRKDTTLLFMTLFFSLHEEGENHYLTNGTAITGIIVPMPSLTAVTIILIFFYMSAFH